MNDKWQTPEISAISPYFMVLVQVPVLVLGLNWEATFRFISYNVHDRANLSVLSSVRVEFTRALITSHIADICYWMLNLKNTATTEEQV